MITCWLIYRYTDRLCLPNAKRFEAETYEEISKDMNDFKNTLTKNVKILDVAETIYKDEDDDE